MCGGISEHTGKQTRSDIQSHYCVTCHKSSEPRNNMKLYESDPKDLFDHGMNILVFQNLKACVLILLTAKSKSAVIDQVCPVLDYLIFCTNFKLVFSFNL